MLLSVQDEQQFVGINNEAVDYIYIVSEEYDE